jgi:hypothetical protein
MTRAALVDSSSNVVVNIIVLGGGYEPPSGITVVASDTASIGDTYENGVFTSPAPSVVPAEPPGQWVPPMVSNAQARAVLFMSTSPVSTSGTMLDAVNAAVTAAGGEALIAWEYASDIHRDSMLVQTIGQSTAIGLTSDQIDQLFVTASSISF